MTNYPWQVAGDARHVICRLSDVKGTALNQMCPALTLRHQPAAGLTPTCGAEPDPNSAPSAGGDANCAEIRRSGNEITVAARCKIYIETKNSGTRRRQSPL